MRSRFRRLPTRTKKARTKRPSISGNPGAQEAAPHLRLQQGVTFLTRPVEAHFRARVQILFAVPEFHTINRAPLARQLDFASFSAGANALSDGKLLFRAVTEMNDNAQKLDRAAAD